MSKVYRVGKHSIIFSENDVDDYIICLCTFPHNNEEKLDVDYLRSLALFGAVVRLIFDGYYDGHDDDYIFIPADVPQWIRDEIERLTNDGNL